MRPVLEARVERVPCEFQKGGNEMLRVAPIAGTGFNRWSDMSRGGKILILVLLSFASALAFGAAQKVGHPELKLFFACTTVGLAVGTIAVALSRGDSRRP